MELEREPVRFGGRGRSGVQRPCADVLPYRTSSVGAVIDVARIRWVMGVRLFGRGRAAEAERSWGAAHERARMRP